MSNVVLIDFPGVRLNTSKAGLFVNAAEEHMWTIDRIAKRNSDQPRRLDVLLQTQSASEEMLCEVAEFLEDGFGPQVCCFAQLPFPLAIPVSERFDVPTGRWGGNISLSFRRLSAEFSNDFQLILKEVSPIFNIRGKGMATQVLGYCTLWGRFNRDYNKYLLSQSDNGLINQPLNASLFDRRRAPAGYGDVSERIGEMRTSIFYELEASRSIAHMFMRALNIWIENYRIVALDDLALPDTVPGFFMMLAPGRIRFLRPPISLAPFLLQEDTLPACVDSGAVKRAMRFGRRRLDRYLHQVLAMERVTREGEPELAAGGYITAIEWYMNSFVAPPERFVGERKWSLRIGDCLKEKSFRDCLSDELKERLRRIAKWRNDIIHGPPPLRVDSNRERAMGETISLIAATAMDLYREMEGKTKVNFGADQVGENIEGAKELGLIED
jgi:hypothetical protein